MWWWKTVREQQKKAHSARTGADGGDPDDPKRPSWGVLQLGILAALKAQAEAEAREAKQRSSPRQKKFIESVKKTLRSMGILKDQVREIRRQIAATKIQRAWRAHIRYDPASHDGSQDGSGEDTMGAGFGGGSDAFPSRTKKVAVGKALHKRSVMRQYAKNNSRQGGKSDQIRDSTVVRPGESRFQHHEGRGGRDSQVGSDMRELTGQRVAMGVLLALLFTVLFTYIEPNTTRPTAMIVLHQQTRSQEFQEGAIDAARNTSIPFLYKYQLAEGRQINKILKNNNYHEESLRPREIMRITVTDSANQQTIGWFAMRYERRQAAWVQFVATVFVFVIWFFGVNAFAGPVMSLVVIPIERMVRLLGMIMVDPLGYQKNARFKKFLIEEDVQYRNTRWTKEVLKGMETHFLMSTILRIGSLMRVGFGSAGVEIIRNNLQRGQGKGKNTLILNSQGSTVACIFLFCDIRQFTDATECLQEEVFVFTNRIASVVHSICNSYGGAANKNVGDAFLMSWLLDDEPDKLSSSRAHQHVPFGSDDGSNSLKAKNNQADKALYSVIKICIALHYDNFYIETMTDGARTRLLNKIKNRPGPVVQMGFGLHAGKAVQGAIGSQRKIDATYVSEAVERSEFLESSTKQYGLSMLMSDRFHRLLHANTRRRCRKIDQLLLQEGADEDEDGELNGEIMELYTFDMDIDAIRKAPPKVRKLGDPDAMSDTESEAARARGARRLDRRGLHGSSRQIRRRRSVQIRGGTSEELVPNNSSPNLADMHAPSIGGASVSSDKGDDNASNNNAAHASGEQLILPTGLALYSLNVWQTPDMKRIRLKYVESLFFQKFNSGLQAFYKKDWDTAKQCFQTVLDTFDDGPSKYFMAQMKKYDGVPPKDFLGYGIA
jgi:class 3 adenylate cyclase